MQSLEADDPRVIGEYRLLRRLGAGGMGRVYLGRSPGGRTVAVKVVHPHFAADEQFRERFRREVRSARQVGGEWTAPVLDADADADLPWVATGYVAGPTLQHAIAGHGPLPEAAVRALGAGLAEALTAVHGLGLVHRDIKPSNVLLTLDGPRLIDFGIARATDGTTALTSTGVSIGSPGYMSPEQVLGKGPVGPASDVFSLGAVLAYAATGASPFPGDSSHALLYLVVHEEPELDDLHGPLRELIAGCLAKDARERPSTAQVAEALAGPVGASGLIRPGWLPGPLVEEASRSAVQLLDLEPELPEQPDQPGGSGENVSGLVPFTHPAQRAGAGAGAEAGAGIAPPDAPAVPPPLPASPPLTTGGPAGRGRFALSAHATSAPAPTAGPPGAPSTRRGRQLSCTLVLSVAGVLVAALLSATLVFDLLPGSGSQGDNSNNSADSGHSESPSPTGDPTFGEDQPPGDRDGEEPARRSVPDAFVGTWKGELYMDSGLRNGTLTITLKKGEPGDLIGTGKVVNTGLECSGAWKLTSATDKTLRTDASSGDRSLTCSKGGTNEVFTLREDGSLRYESNDSAGGNAAGTLKKTG
ncbi:serine/threonine protein kinase [Streptomyces sp. N2-109]|uniref:Serine/threonine protein kinase n=1 Tax=Streptomyces gossypii TaxID=2883101 RepID=A0ABT2JW44_9ACTN|nr:serine/threonine-protein kinase [Streptomyces gossypii]MCT2592118.1 serine/threonine protein kinase [Streptomyces gossypii]